jgi:O-antigen ligase
MTLMPSALRNPRAPGTGQFMICLAVVIGMAWLVPTVFPEAIVGVLGVGGVILALRHPTAFWLGWILVTGLSLEMALADIIGPEAFQPTIAVTKGGEIALVTLTIIRFGCLADKFNPAFGFVWMAATGLAFGLYPGVTHSDVARSLVGSVAPFLVFYCVKPAGWGSAIRTAVTFIPLLSVTLGIALDVAGLRSVVFDAGGLRLSGLGHPAFLAGICLPAIYSGLLRWLRTGSARAVPLLIINLTILLLTGARAPAAYAAVVVLGSLVLAPGGAIPRVKRQVIAVALIVALPLLVIVGEAYGSFRLFEVLAGQPDNLSGRDQLWPSFEAAAAQAPWLGWGLGSANLIIPHDSQLAVLLGTWAAHNEYLRLQVEGGYIGLGLLILLFVVWISSHTRRLPRLERSVMRLIFVTYAAHAATDNVLISSPACVFFAFVAAVFADGHDERRIRLRDTPEVA